MEYEFLTRNSARQEFAEAAIRFHIKELKLQKSKWQLCVAVNASTENPDATGCVSEIAPGLLVLFLNNKLDYEKLSVTIAHELVHVKQYATGRFRYGYRRGKVVPFWCGKPCYIKSYYDQPWELAAFKQERLLANKFAQHMMKVSWKETK